MSAALEAVRVLRVAVGLVVLGAWWFWAVSTRGL